MPYVCNKVFCIFLTYMAVGTKCIIDQISPVTGLNDPIPKFFPRYSIILARHGQISGSYFKPPIPRLFFSNTLALTVANKPNHKFLQVFHTRLQIA